MVEPATDDAEQHAPGRDVEGLARFSAAGNEPATGQPHRQDDAEQDAQGVHPDRQRSEVEDPDGGAREVRGHLVAFSMTWVSSSGVLIVFRSTVSPLIRTVGVPWNLGILKAASFTEVTYAV